MRLEGRRALITGGNRGLGLAIARSFLDEGARVSICGRDPRSLDELRSLAYERMFVHSCDIADLDELSSFIEASARQLGGLDIVVANAGISPFCPLADADEQHFDHLVSINLKGTYFTVQKALPHLRDGASVILVSSIAHRIGTPSSTVYSATRAATRSLARTMSADLLERGIRVNCISPGPIETGAIDRHFPPEVRAEMRGNVAQRTALRRMGRPEEISGLAVFLASDESSFIVGEDVIVDGGLVHVEAPLFADAR